MIPQKIEFVERIKREYKQTYPNMVWLRDDGLTASIYGTIPWETPEERKRWKLCGNR